MSAVVLVTGMTASSLTCAQSAGITDISQLSSDVSSATAVSADGKVVVGGSNLLGAYRWTLSSGMTGLGVLSAGQFAQALAVNADGNVIVGIALLDPTLNPLAGFQRAFLWTPVGGMTNLGVLNGGNFSKATGVNSGGTVVVGEATDGALGNNAIRAFRWT